MAKTITIKIFGKEHTCVPEFACYKVRDPYNDMMKDFGLESYEKPLYGLALILTDEQGYDDVATVSLGEFIGTKNLAYFDVNNLGNDIVYSLEAAGVIKNTGLTAHSGFVDYPLCQFTDEFIQTFGDCQAYRDYSDAFDDYCNFRDAEYEIDEDEPDEEQEL